MPLGMGASIKQRLIGASLLASASALLLVGAAFVVYGFMMGREMLVRKMSVQADIIGANCVTAILFGDPQSAEGTLAALRAEPGVEAAAVYAADGTRFAQYVRGDLPRESVLARLPSGPLEGHRYAEGGLVLSRPIVFNGTPIGTVVILSDLREIRSRIGRYVAIVAVVLLASFGVALAVASVLQRRISGPILHLAHTARRVAVEKDYSVRATGDSRDEIGLLVMAFNDMLAQIRQRDAELQEAHSRLEQRVAERTAQLEAANKELEAFSYSVSHDLRAPLRHIAGFAELLGQEAGEALSEAARKHLQKISTAAGRMGQLIDDLLVFSRMGRSEMQRVKVNLSNLVNDVLKDLQPEIKDRRIEWAIDSLPQVRGDPAMLRLVLTNLVANAVKYTRKRDDPRIEVGASGGNGGEVVVFVRDNGVGFDMQYAPKLFGVFQRLHRAEEFEGTGIGLANVRRIIHRHGGRTWAEGQPGRGAAFYFSLPNNQETTR